MTKPYHANPRNITRKQLAALASSLADLGDLGGIIHNRRTDEIIGGNQRSEVIKINDCQIEIVHRNETPDAQGTLAHGFAIWNGARYAYRLVDWDEARAQEANIKANSLGGAWDFDTLANSFDASSLLDWGFDTQALQDTKRAASGIQALLDSLKPAPSADDWADAFERLPDGERAPFQQMTFTLHDDQAELVKEALAIAKKSPGINTLETQNQNSNGNALYLVFAEWMANNG